MTISSYPTNLSDHFSFLEGVHSTKAEELGVSNLPEDEMILVNMLHTAERMEIVRNILGPHAIHINSWYRCPEVNHAVGSKDTSDHLKGNAVDFTCPDFGNPVDICRHLISYQDAIKFKQLILEHTWVHISWDSDPNVNPKLQVLSLLNSGSYAVGLTDPSGKYYS